MAKVGICALTCVTQFLNCGGSLGTITGEPGLCDEFPLAATNIQWSNAVVEIGFPATLATELPGMLLPQAERATTATKKAPSAKVRRKPFMCRRW